MFTTVEGIYKNGVVTLANKPELQETQVRVLVTFLKSDEMTVSAELAEAAEMRSKLESFIEDWDDPAMDVYDNYDENLNALRKGPNHSS